MDRPRNQNCGKGPGTIPHYEVLAQYRDSNDLDTGREKHYLDPTGARRKLGSVDPGKIVFMISYILGLGIPGTFSMLEL